MKKYFFLLFIAQLSLIIPRAQEIPPVAEQQLENITEIGENETIDNSYLQQLEYLRKDPLNLNTAKAEELRELIVLTNLQIASLISYRKLLGKFLNIYELGSVPGWDLTTINKILPYIRIGDVLSVKENVGKRFKNGDRSLLLRFSTLIENLEEFENGSPSTKFLGSKPKLLLRYRYQLKTFLTYGITAEKDAGERLFGGSQKYGFDFYSIHFFAKKIGKIRALALGDFTVNMGQGLIQWQTLAFKKSVDISGIKRQYPLLIPYTSSGEFYFHRGAGLTMGFGKCEATVFASFRKLSAHFDNDTAINETLISSFLNSGYHRTENEIASRNNVSQLAFGANIQYRKNNWHIGANGVYYGFSLPVQKRDEPYNAYAINGKTWNNFSVDYSYTWRNIHFFGEAASDKNLHIALVNGLLLSVDPKVDIAIVHRSIKKEYQAVYGNAFTENTLPSNEKGLYAGISIRPGMRLRLDMYADVFRFPWVKYLVDAPSAGKDFLVQLTYTPDKQLELYSRYHSSIKQSNQSGEPNITNFLVSTQKQNWRTQLDLKLNDKFRLRNRIELVWFRKEKNNENGFLSFIDLIYKPLKPYSGIVRLQYFETDDYNSRIYAYENDVLYSYSIPSFSEKGYRYYINMNYDVKKNISFWLRWSQTISRDKNNKDTGSTEKQGKSKSEIRLQGMYSF